MAIVARLPSQLPIHPQASFPAAPPIKTSVNADKKGADVPGLPNRRFA
jgi:hypothetical protein